MVLGARLRTVMSSIIRWRKAEILPAGGTEYAEGLLLLMRATVMENPVERHVGDSGDQVGRGNRTPRGGIVQCGISPPLSLVSPRLPHRYFEAIMPAIPPRMRIGAERKWLAT